MKNILAFTGLFILYIVLFSGVDPVPSIAQQESKMQSDPRFEDAMESYEKGQSYMKRGYREIRARPGQAQKMFEHAEDYFLKAKFMYGELGIRHGIDVKNEVAVCEKAYRGAHVQTGKARKRARKK